MAAAMILILAALGASADGGVASRNGDMANAIREMQKAGRYTFAMLINMSPADLLQSSSSSNVTFLIPSDKTLSGKTVTNATDFLLRHAIPSPMLFHHLSSLPTGSLLPSLHPGYALRVSNRGRLSIFLNNARLTSPNLCVAGMSVRCHGIDDTLGGPSVPSCLPSPPISPDPSPAVDSVANAAAPAVGPEPSPGPGSRHHVSKSSPAGHRAGADTVAFLALATFFFFYHRRQ
uniref:FAS1 domain-containing protein n=1 Tax=Kalanchoe fedtschenkoi TaxID=63787 RepID=A0A7N0UAB1_KALFE